MSRTDKDTPAWVTATWVEPAHRTNCTNGTFWINGTPEARCTLPDHPVRERRRRGLLRECVWEPVHDPARRYCDTAPAWYINHRWNAPDRLRSRTECQDAIKEYRATGEVDLVPATDQHRHNATWGWS